MFTANGSSVQMETVKINSQLLQLPAEICSNEKIFDEFFSFETWKSLSPAIRDHLTSNFLPDFYDSNPKEKEKTINTLLSRNIINFNTEVLSKLQNSLASGKLSNSSKKKHKKSWPSRREKLKSYEDCQRICRMLKKLTDSRDQILQSNNNKLVISTSAHCPRSVFHIYKSSKKRYFSELQNISMCDDTGLSSDDLEDYSLVNTRSKRRKMHKKLNFSNVIINTLDTDANATMLENMDNKWYREALLSYQKDKASLKNDFTSINVEDLFERTQLDVRKIRNQTKAASSNKKQSIKTGRPVGRPKVNRDPEESASKKNTDNEFDNSFIPSNPKIDSKENSKHNLLVKSSEAAALTSEKMSMVKTKENILLRQPKRESLESMKDPVSLSDLDTMGIIQMPLEFGDVENMNLLDELNTTTKMPELLQETHACFLSLIRDILCSTPDHRMSLDELKRKVNFWLLNPITPLNEWYHQSENWFYLLPSAVFFLTGEFTDQPEDFVPYLEYKVHLNIYQWIGAGRDTDNNLVPLCNYWLSRRNDMGTKKGSVHSKSTLLFGDLLNMENQSEETSNLDRSISPPPARFPTDWIVTTATSEEIEDFHEQERRRYESPHMPFTYYQHNYESVVGPIKGIYTQQLPGITKARGHNMLVQNRPNFVTILTLVRDAAARLPNGEGTRADICELLKSSQFINPTSSDVVLQTIVSGALDRMHTEPDPCVKYDSKRKIWIYLHRNRSESEFEKMHLQQQCVVKPKKIICKKQKPKTDKTVHSNISCSPSIISSRDLVSERNSMFVDANNVVKTATHKLIPQSSASIITQTEQKKNVGATNNLSPSLSMGNKGLVLPTVINKSITQNLVPTKMTAKNSTISSIQYPTSAGFLSKLTAHAIPTVKKVQQTSLTNENKILVQNDFSELSKIGIIPQKIIQVSPNRFHSNSKGNVLTLNKIPVSLANYATGLNQKIVQVKPIGGTISNVISTGGMPTLKRANFQIKTPSSISSTVTSTKIINAPTRPTSMVTVKNIQSLPTINMSSKADLATVKVQPVTRNSSMPVFLTKTSDGITVLSNNRQIVQPVTASRTVTTKANDLEPKTNFGIISPNRSLLLNDKLQKSGSPVTQIVRVANPNSGQIKPLETISGVKVQQLPVSSISQKDPKAKNVGQLLNAKVINVQPNSDNKIKTFSGIRMINASDLNIANINGKQIIIATKSFLSQNPQNMVFQGANCSKLPNNKQTITFNKGNLQSTSQSTMSQQILFPKFQGGQINVKTMQGIKIIPFTPTMSGASQIRGTPAKPIQTSPIIKKDPCHK